MVNNANDWILYTRATRYICSNKRMLQEFEENVDEVIVYMGNFIATKLTKLVLKIVLESYKTVITRNEDFVGKGYLFGGLFVLNTVKMNNNTSNFSYIVESINLWHGTRTC
ncbi:hypothetical protein CR513_39153, partial [Mucuna pruriens]